MRSNISRAVVVAAAATGIWALGNVAANAATLPSVPSTGSLSTVTNTLGSPASTLPSPTGAVNGVVESVTAVPGSAPGILTTRNLNNTLQGLQESAPGITRTFQSLTRGLTRTGQIEQPLLAHAHQAKGLADNLRARSATCHLSRLK